MDDAPDAVAFPGDDICEYPGAANAVRSHADGWTLTLADYRNRYALHQSDTALQAAHAACPWLLIWDDQEVHNDYASLTPGDAGPPAPDFAARRAAAYQAFCEHMPLCSSVQTRALAGLSAGADMWRHGQARCGRLATLSLLDARQHQSPPACTRDGMLGASTVNPADCPAWNDPTRTLLGAEQEQWLHQALRGGNGGWSLIAQTSVFGPRDFKPGAGQSLWNDGRDGYGPSRQRLIDTLRRERVANPVLLGGDLHENWVGHVKADHADAVSANVGVAFCGTSITSHSGGNARKAEQWAENPHFVYAEGERKGYGLIDLTPQQMDVSLRVVSDVTQADAGIETLASFTVAAGRPVIERR